MNRVPFLRLVVTIAVLCTLAVPAAASLDFVKVTTAARGSASHDALKQPAAAAVDTETGAIWVADRQHHQVRRIAVSGLVTVVAGTGQPGLADGPASQAKFKEPAAVVFDSQRNVLYVADSGNDVIRRIDAGGNVTTIASADLKAPAALAIDAAGVLYIADTGNHKIKSISPTGIVTALGTSARFQSPAGIAVTRDGKTLFVADTGNHVIRSITAGNVTTIAGAGRPGNRDGAGAAAEFHEPTGIAYGDGDSLVVSDRRNHILREVLLDGTVRTLTAGGPGYADGVPPAALMHEPLGLSLAGAAFVADSQNDAVRIVWPALHATSIEPSNGSAEGGDVVHLFGSGFVPGRTEVRIGGTTAIVSYVSSTELLVTTPAGNAGPAAVVVTTEAGMAVLGEDFVYGPRLVSVSILPSPATVEINQTLQLAVKAHYSDGSIVDSLSGVIWTSEDAAVASVDTTGLVAGVAIGSTTINARKDNVSASATITVQQSDETPDPKTVASKIDPTVATSFADSTKFLYDGPNALQRELAPGAIEQRRVSIVRGRVVGTDGAPIKGVRVSVVRDAKFGYTLTRADGAFDLALNGGGLATIRYEKDGYISSQRQVSPRWLDYEQAPEVVLVAYDGNVTTVTAGAGEPQVARGSRVADSDGSRQATMIFPAATTATMTLPDGSTRALTSLAVRATEYSVGPNGQKAMPATLPAQSGYTYCVELSVDEAVAAGATKVTFSKPIAFYVENFLGFPTGGIVPTGWYDREKAVWVPSKNGKVVAVASIDGGLATLDLDGDGAGDSEAAHLALGIDAAERTRVAALYQPGRTLWRVPIPHFTPWDHNWPYGPPAGATPPAVPTPRAEYFTPKPGCESGSVIECDTMTLGDRVSLAGSPFSMHYSSARSQGRTAARTMDITLSGATVPPVLRAIDLEIEVAGQKFVQTFSAAANQKTRFTWNGLDAYGRVPQGPQQATIRIGYRYEAVYQKPAEFDSSFGAFSGVPLTAASARSEITAWQENGLRFGPWTANAEDLGGWSVGIHHTYDPFERTVHFGHGGSRSVKAAGNIVESAVASSSTYVVTPAPDGSLYYSTGNEIMRRAYDGTATRVAGGGTDATGNGIPATQAQLQFPQDLTIMPDGTVVFIEGGGTRIRRLDQDGRIWMLAGTGTAGEAGDGGPAVNAQLNSAYGIAAGTDGSLYVVQAWPSNRVRRIAPDGIINRFAGNGTDGGGGDGGPAPQAQFSSPVAIATGPDGSVYVMDWYNLKVRRIGTDGIMSTAAGCGWGCPSGSSAPGRPATETSIDYSRDVTVGADGSLYIAQYGQHKVAKVDTNGVFSVIAGGGGCCSFQGGRLATDTFVSLTESVGVGADGTVFYGDNSSIKRIVPTLPSVAIGEISIPSTDGREVYVFAANGRHLRTLDALTGAPRWRFEYDAEGRLLRIRDFDGRATTIVRNAAGEPTSIVAANGETMTLATSNGRVESVVARGQTTRLTYTGSGLLNSKTTPGNTPHTYSYDADGKVASDSDSSRTKSLLATTTSSLTQQTVSVAIGTTLGRMRTYITETLSRDAYRLTRRDAAGVQATNTIESNGTSTITTPTGMQMSESKAPDPRFGMTAPSKAIRTTTPAGLTLSLSESRSVTMGNAAHPLGLRSSVRTISRNGRNYTETYDAPTSKITWRSPAGRQLAMTIDGAQRATRLEYPGLQPQVTQYTNGLLMSITNGTRQTTFGYGALDRLTSATNALQQTTGYDYDPMGRVSTVRLANGRSVGYEFDDDDNLTGVTPPGRGTHRFTYTPTGLRSSYTPPGGGTTSYTYDADGQVQTVTLPDTSVLAFDYDDAGRLESLTSPSGTELFTFDTSGRLAKTTAPDGSTVSYGYDGVLLRTVTTTGAIPGTVTLGYNNDLRLTSQTVGGTGAIAFGYDADGLLTSAGALTLTRDFLNGFLSLARIGNITESYTYDPYGDMQSFAATFSGATLLRFDYSRDALGRISQVVEALAGTTVTSTYKYDEVGRLTEATRGADVTRYQYDANGNRTARTTASTTETGASDGQDQQTSYAGATYTYNATGDLASKTDATGTTTYTYDAFGTLRQVVLSDGRRIEYATDAQHRRVGKRVNGVLTRGWIYGEGPYPLAETDAAGTIVSRFVYALKINVPDYFVRGGVAYRIITDHLGSPRLVVNAATGMIMQSIGYDEFGRVLADSSPGFQPFGFAGGLYDPDTKLLRFGARDYDSTTGRWTSHEPLGFAGGADTNLYAYAFGDPVNLIDPDGLKVHPPNFVGPLLPGDSRSYAANMNDPEIEAMALGFQATHYYYPPGTKAEDRDECVALTKFFSRAPCTSCWRKGVPVMGSNIAPGTAVATFVNGRYPQTDVPKNSGIFVKHIPNGFTIIDQWEGNFGRTRDLYVDPRQGRSDRADTYSVITAPAGECGCSTRF